MTESLEPAHPNYERAVVVNKNAAATNGAWRNVAIAVGHKAPDGAAARDYQALLQHVINRHPNGVGMITIVRDRSTPTPEARDTMLQMFRKLDRHILCAAFVVEGKGFGAATQRSVLAALLLTLKLGDRLKVFATAAEATPWVASRLEPTKSGSSLERLSNTLGQVVQDFAKKQG